MLFSVKARLGGELIGGEVTSLGWLMADHFSPPPALWDPGSPSSSGPDVMTIFFAESRQSFDTATALYLLFSFSYYRKDRQVKKDKELQAYVNEVSAEGRGQVIKIRTHDIV